MSENVPSDMCARRRIRVACAFVQFDQNLPLADFGWPRMQIFFYVDSETDHIARLGRLI